MARIYHTAHKRAKNRNLVRNLVTELILHEHLKVTKKRKVDVQRLFDRVITWAKKGSLHDIRKISQVLRMNVQGGNDNTFALAKLKVLAKKHQERPGGYLNVYRLGKRSGDNAPIYLLKII